MKREINSIRLSAGDLSNHLDCAHLTTLEYSAATGRIAAPDWTNPDTAVLQQLGFEHERKYLEHLVARGLEVADLRSIQLATQATEETQEAMRQGADVIAQAVLASGRWFGRADVLQRVGTPSNLGAWSYEVYDCKLARETKAATILQLSLYSDLLARIQGTSPRFMHVVSPSELFSPESFLVTEYAAYYRLVKSRLEQSVDANPSDDATHAEPNSHCEVCRWWKKCDAEWRADDHLSLVAGISRLQRKQLGSWDINTMAQLARFALPLAKRPEYGSKEGYVRVREQARVQVAGRETRQPVHELFDNAGLARLPEPSPGDIFFDLEGDSFVGTDGMEYLFGFVRRNQDGTSLYERRWAFNPAEENAAFEWFVGAVMEIWTKHFDMHVYHFTAREPSALKRLMGKYASREDAVDRILRGQLLVDVHRAFKQSVRASVEEYSLKTLEQFYGFARGTSLKDARRSRRLVEHSLELGRIEAIDELSRATIEGYNRDDCASTEALRDWLEEQRDTRISEGQQILRPAESDSQPSAKVDERQQRVAALIAALTQGMPPDLTLPTNEQSARSLLANLLDWHRREDKAVWWEFYHLKDLSDDDLLDERGALSGLRHIQRMSVERKIAVDRYTFERQETNIRPEDEVYFRGDKIGTVMEMDLDARWLDIKKMKKTADIHPTSIYSFKKVNIEECEDSLYRLATWVFANGLDSPGQYRCGRDLLLRNRPRLLGETQGYLLRKGEDALTAAKRLVLQLDSSVLAIQGPPGSGKTFTGAQLICELVRHGKKIGVTGPSHKAIRTLLEEVLSRAEAENLGTLSCIQKVTKESEVACAEITEVTKPAEAIKALHDGTANVVGGTVWLWAPETSADVVDVLVVDEAGQMSLANVLAAAQSARSLVLLGDPQQLDQPLKGSHPDGAAVSALEHLLPDGAKTISPDRGLFLEHTWRLHPHICAFTSEAFYESRLQSRDGLEKQCLDGHAYLNGAGPWFVGIDHEGNQNASPEEAAVVEALVRGLLLPGVTWFNAKPPTPACVPLAPKDILVIAPYNVQVSDISNRLPRDVRVGTVDKFQGQEAAIVIYSLTTSSPEDAPRGMEFLYSLNRLNVATSRGRALCVVVGSPRLLEPQCRTPRQMQLANALCRFAELARRIEVRDARDGQYEFVAIPAA
jgi:predicted RecB family nuclease